MITGHDIHKILGISSVEDSHGVYVGFQQIGDVRAPTKIGRSKNAQAIQRGRAQGGAEWWFAAYFELPNKAATQLIEKQAKLHFKEWHIKGTQRQTELYDIDADKAVLMLAELIATNGFSVRNFAKEIPHNG